MKGFTLAELMGVIVILGILAVIITTTIDRNIVNSRIQTCKSQEENLIQAAQMYVTDNANKPEVLPNVGGEKHITIAMLRGDSGSGYEENNYIADDMENPMTGKFYNPSTYVEITLNEDSTGQTENPKNYHYDVVYVDETECPNE